MANETDEAKAAKARADADKAAAKAKAAADKAEADAKAKAEAEAAAVAAAAAAPPAATKRAAKAELQEHVVTREVNHDGDLYAAGEDILLTRDQHAQLHAVGAVEEAWRD
jgi:hypothetical protein